MIPPRREFIPIPPLTERDIARFWSHVDKTPGQGPNGECWTWTGARFDKRGYGAFVMPRPRTTFRAPRIAWFITTGEDPQTLKVLHRCDNPPCVRCLFTGTSSDNRQDAIAKGRVSMTQLIARSAEVQKAKTHCKKGHEYTPYNTIRKPRGRTCRTCAYESAAKRKAA